MFYKRPNSRENNLANLVWTLALTHAGKIFPGGGNRKYAHQAARLIVAVEQCGINNGCRLRHPAFAAFGERNPNKQPLSVAFDRAIQNATRPGFGPDFPDELELSLHTCRSLRISSTEKGANQRIKLLTIADIETNATLRFILDATYVRCIFAQVQLRADQLLKSRQSSSAPTGQRFDATA